MFGLLKWIIILGIFGTIWFAYDLSIKLSVDEKHALKKDAIEALDNGNTEPLTKNLKDKVLHQFDERKNSFFESVRKKLREWIEN